MSKKYIAYGSNMNLEQMAQRCPTAEKIMTGKVIGYELQFRGDLHNAFATIEPNEDSQIDVLLWKIKDRDEKSLDMYEGYPRFYDKQTILVLLEDGSQTEAMVYVMNPEFKLGLPSIRYFKTIAEGYLDNGLELQPLINAVAGTYQAIIEQELEPIQKDGDVMHKAIIKTLIAVLTDKEARKKAGKIILVALSPLLLFILTLTAAADAGSQHNNGLISTLFEYREVPGTAPDEFKSYVETMQDYFREIDDEINTIQPQIKEGSLDVIQIKSFFLSVFIQQETAPDLTQQQLHDYVLCFVEKEEAIEDEVPDESGEGENSEETVQKIYTVIINQEAIKNNVQEALNVLVTDQMMDSFHSILMHVNPGSNASIEGDGYSLAVQFAPLIEVSRSKEYVGGQMGSPFLDGWKNKVTSEYGHREEITLPDGTVTSTKHTGLDMGAVSGTPILALNDGEVVYVRNHKKGLGLHLVVDHGGGKLSVYGHTSRIIVKEGDKVTKGQKIAEVGTTGFSTGNHLHLEIWENGQPHNPRNYLD